MSMKINKFGFNEKRGLWDCVEGKVIIFYFGSEVLQLDLD